LVSHSNCGSLARDISKGHKAVIFPKMGCGNELRQPELFFPSSHLVFPYVNHKSHEVSPIFLKDRQEILALGNVQCSTNHDVSCMLKLFTCRQQKVKNGFDKNRRLFYFLFVLYDLHFEIHYDCQKLNL
jgi:hypothetical protein